jgi:beta-lactamase superfamily II metal-dependent hydrolase
MPATQDKNIRIRMYRVGFGDCFLVTLPGTGQKPHHILIDCGVHPQGDIKTMAGVVGNIVSETGGEMDLIVAKHAHQDHLSGFGSRAQDFRKMHVREVWLPWTENGADRAATDLKKKHLALVDGLQRHFAAFAGARYGEVKAALVNLAGNETALTLLKSQLRAKVEYREAGEHIADAAGIQGLDVKVLGPPRDKTFLARMDPPASERYLRAVAEPATGGSTLAPFPPKWAYEYDKLPLSESDLKYFDDLAADTGEALAFALTQAINNTSVVLLMRYGAHAMLFAGDAQYGNWQFWLDQKDAQELLAGVSFYKVAHHGSENATPRDALDRMSEGKFAAMVSTQNTPWPSIPYANLMSALETRTGSRIVRSDSLAVKGAPAGPGGPVPSGFQKGQLWFDYCLPMEKSRHAKSGA